MAEPLVWTETRQRMCNVCGALVGDIDMHAGWHKQLADPAPEPDPWEEALGETDIPPRGWDWHLGNALRMAATALQGGHDLAYHRDCLAVAAANIRAMAPQGTKWEEPWKVQQGTERHVLRSVPWSLLTADHRRGSSPADTAGGLVAADAYLHGLWLAAKEG